MSAWPRTAALTALLFATPAAADSASPQRLEVGFMSAAGVSVVVELAASSRGPTVSRSGSWVFSTGGDAVVVSAQDVVGTQGLDDSLPSPPATVGVRYEGDGSVLITLTGLGDWQRSIELEPLGGRAHANPPGVADIADARLEVTPRPGEELTARDVAAGTLRVIPAVLYGTRGAVSGLAWVDSRPTPAARVVALDGDELIMVPTGGEGVFVADVAQTCEATTPRALTAQMDNHPSVRLLATGKGGCLLSGAAVVPLLGAWLDKRTEKPAHAVAIVVRERGAAATP